MRTAFVVRFAASLLTASSAVVLSFPANAQTARAGVVWAKHSPAAKECPPNITAASLEGQWVGQVNRARRLDLTFTAANPSRPVHVEERASSQPGGTQRRFNGDGSYTAYGGKLDITATGQLIFQTGILNAYTVRYTISSATCEGAGGRTKVKQFQVRSVDVDPATIYTMKRA